MQSIWRKHLIICLFLGLLAIPIYFLDLAFTEEKKEAAIGSHWISAGLSFGLTSHCSPSMSP